MKFITLDNTCITESVLDEALSTCVESNVLQNRIELILYEMRARRGYNLSRGEELLFREFFKMGYAAAHVLNDNIDVDI